MTHKLLRGGLSGLVFCGYRGGCRIGAIDIDFCHGGLRFCLERRWRISQCRCVRVWFRVSPGSFFRRMWLHGSRHRSDGDFASESALVVDLIRSGSATRGFVNVWWFVATAWFRETSPGSGFVAAEVARNTDLVVFA